MSCCEVEGEFKDSMLQPISPEGTFMASRCVVNLKPAPQIEVPGQANRTFSQERLRCVLVCSLCSALEVVACQKLPLPIVPDLWGQKCKPCWPPGSGAQRVSRMWTTHVLSLAGPW